MKKIEKLIVKLLSQMQLDVEISKFEDENTRIPVEGEVTPEEALKTTLQDLVVVPFAERLNSFLSDIFA